MKRIFVLTVAVILIVGCIAMTAYADSGLAITATASSQAVQKGDTVEIKVSIAGYGSKAIPEIGGLQIDVTVDPEYFDYVEKSAVALLDTRQGDLINYAYNSSKNQFTFMYAYMNADATALDRNNTDIVSFELKVKQTLPENKMIELPMKVAIADTAAPAQEITVTVKSVSLMSLSSIASESQTDGQIVSSSPPIDGSSDITSQSTSENSMSSVSTEIIVPIAPEDRLPWDEIVISCSEEKSVTVEKTDNGILIKNNDLSDIVITVSKENKTAEVIVSDDEVMIREKDDEVVAYADKDNDGVFEAETATAKYRKMDNHGMWSVVCFVVLGMIIAATVTWFLVKKCRRS